MKRIVLIVTLVIVIVLLALSTATAQEQLPPINVDIPATPLPRPLPTRVVADGDIRLAIYFDSIAQGQAGVAEITAPNMIGARAQFLDRRTEFFPMPDGGYYGLLSASMERNPRTYDLTVFVLYADGTSHAVTTPVEVIRGAFIRQEVTVAGDKTNLLDPVLERSELARMESIFSVFTPERMWDEGGFQLPLDTPLTSTFGAFRTFNGSIPSRHTGWDQRAPIGTPVMASATGRVAFTGELDIRGNHVVIDHGYGVFTTYSHFSQIHVTRGQFVSKGQVIGVTGETGRAGGPHFHWEVAVNGEFVDGVEFLQMWLPL